MLLGSRPSSSQGVDLGLFVWQREIYNGHACNADLPMGDGDVGRMINSPDAVVPPLGRYSGNMVRQKEKKTRPGSRLPGGAVDRASRVPSHSPKTGAGISGLQGHRLTGTRPSRLERKSLRFVGERGKGERQWRPGLHRFRSPNAVHRKTARARSRLGAHSAGVKSQ